MKKHKIADNKKNGYKKGWKNQKQKKLPYKAHKMWKLKN